MVSFWSKKIQSLQKGVSWAWESLSYFSSQDSSILPVFVKLFNFRIHQLIYERYKNNKAVSLSIRQKKKRGNRCLINNAICLIRFSKNRLTFAMNEILRIQTGKVSYNRTSEKRYENLQKVSQIFDGKQNWRNGHLGSTYLFREF